MRDPVIKFEKELLARKALTGEDIQRIRENIRVEIEDAVKFAEESPMPEPGTVFEDLFA